jgi:hypothetical protein
MLIDEREMMNYCTVLYFATINQSVYLPAVTALNVEVYLLFGRQPCCTVAFPLDHLGHVQMKLPGVLMQTP